MLIRFITKRQNGEIVVDPANMTVRFTLAESRPQTRRNDAYSTRTICTNLNAIFKFQNLFGTCNEISYLCPEVIGQD